MDRRGRVCGCLAGADEIARRTGKADHHEPEEPLFHVHPRGKTSTDYTYATRCSVQYSARRDFKNIIGSEGMCASMQAAETDNDRVPPNAGSRLASGQLDRKQWLIAQAVPGEESVDLVPPCECVAVASSR